VGQEKGKGEGKQSSRVRLTQTEEAKAGHIYAAAAVK
jgi:hypothetical protein